MPTAKPSKKSSVKKSNIFVRAINKFSNLHAPAKVLVLAVTIGIVGGGSYAVYMSSAAGWTYMGQHTFYNTYTRSSVTFKAYSCKTSVVKSGYKVKSMARITEITGNPAKNEFYMQTYTSRKGLGSANGFYNNVPKLYQTITTGYVGGATSSDYVKTFIQDLSSDGNASPSFSKTISSLSTCP